LTCKSNVTETRKGRNLPAPLEKGCRPATQPASDHARWPHTSRGRIIRVPTPVIVLALLCLVATAPPAEATQTWPGPPSIEQLTRRAEVVVLGEVSSTAGEWDAARTNIYTRVALIVTEVLKGPAAPSLTFTQLGGRVGGESSAVGGAAKFQPGERVLDFLARRPDGSLPSLNLRGPVNFTGQSMTNPSNFSAR
jgi:hypothetical protein